MDREVCPRHSLVQPCHYLGHPDLVKQYSAKGYRYTWIRWGDPYYYLGMVYLSENQIDKAAVRYNGLNRPWMKAVRCYLLPVKNCKF